MIDAMQTRKSVRVYKAGELPFAAEAAIRNWRSWVNPLNDRRSIDNHMRRLPGFAHMEGKYLVKAPGYLMYMSQSKPLAQLKAGFIMEQVSLRLTELGVGTCYLGDARVGAENMGSHKLTPLMIMTVGLSPEPVTRTQAEFKRKPLDEICGGAPEGDALTAIDMARLAPSHCNLQPWYFLYDGRDIDCCAVTPTPDRMGELNEFDLGIAIAHIFLALSELGHRAELICKMAAPDAVPEGYDYYMTVRMDDN